MLTVGEDAPLRPYRGVTGVSASFGTFGELLQGVLPGDEEHFLVTLPIARWSTATFRADPGLGLVMAEPVTKTKAARLAAMIMKAAGMPVGGLLTIDSRLPEGKGMASSSADLVATARAVGNAIGMTMPHRRIEGFLRLIEPTDGVLYDGIVAYDHRRVRLRRMLGRLPSMVVVGVDEGGSVDTIEFNRRPKPFGAEERREYAELLDRLAGAVETGDLAAAGAVSTRSATLNQRLQPKRLLAPIGRVSQENGGLGVVVAHSGTALGVLLDPAAPGFSRRFVTVANACFALAGNVTAYRTLSFS